MCKCNAGELGVLMFSPCSTTANPSLTDDGFKIKFNSTPAWLLATMTGNRFKAPHSTCTKPLVVSWETVTTTKLTCL